MSPGGKSLVRCRRVVLECYEDVLPNGVRILVDRVVFPRSVAVLPVWRERRKIVLIKQYRPTIRDWILEAPAGVIGENENPRDAALRELLEETGLTTSDLELVAEGFVSPGYTTEFLSLFIAWDPEPAARVSPEPHEVIEVVELDLSEAVRMARERAIRDVKTILLLSIAISILGENVWRST